MPEHRRAASPLVALAALCSALLLCASPGRTVAAEESGWEGMGRAPISAGDRVRARERALDEAFQHVVEAAVSALLGPETLTRRAGDLRLKILPRARSYVTSYRIVDEGERETGFFSVQVSAAVAADRLVRELADKAPTSARPATSSLVLLCAAAADGGLVSYARLTRALQELVTGRGLSFVPAGAAATQRCEGEALAPLMKAAGARVALVAELTLGVVAPVRGTSLVGREVKLALRVVEPDGRRSAEGRGEGAGYGKDMDAAAEEAALAALVEATTSVDEALAALGTHSRPGGVAVRVLGVRRFSQLATVRTALERLPGVEGVEPRRFLPGVPGAIELQVRTAQSVRALVEALARVAATYQLRAREQDGSLLIDVPEALDPVSAPGAPQ